jgi:hypothetical protein
MGRSGDGAPQGYPGEGGAGQYHQQRYWQPAAYDPDAHRLAYLWQDAIPRPREGEARPGNYGQPSQPQFRAAGSPPQGPARSEARPDSAGRPSDTQAAVAVLLIFVGLFCGVGAWWLHSARDARTTVRPATAVVARHTTGSADATAKAGGRG